MTTSTTHQQQRAEYIAHLVSDWPPFTEEQASTIRRAFGINQPAVDDLARSDAA